MQHFITDDNLKKVQNSFYRSDSTLKEVNYDDISKIVDKVVKNERLFKNS